MGHPWIGGECTSYAGFESETTSLLSRTVGTYFLDTRIRTTALHIGISGQTCSLCIQVAGTISAAAHDPAAFHFDVVI